MRKLKKIDIRSGYKVGKLTVIDRYDPKTPRKNSLWTCKCECGKEVVVCRPNLISRPNISCGCSFKQIMQDTFQTHGMTETMAYEIWTNMKTRCFNKNRKEYKNYGGRGIYVCKRWKNSFENFLKDMGMPQKGMSIERVDNEKGYSKENCVWIPKAHQSRNRRGNHYIEHEGKKITAREYFEKSEKLRCYETLLKYIKNGNLCGISRWFKVLPVGWNTDAPE